MVIFVVNDTFPVPFLSRHPPIHHWHQRTHDVTVPRELPGFLPSNDRIVQPYLAPLDRPPHWNRGRYRSTCLSGPLPCAVSVKGLSLETIFLQPDCGSL
jgi:hypothetical protein